MLLAACAWPATAQIIDVRQGTNISVAADPKGEQLVVDLLGGLWRLPTTGGGATMLMAAGSGISQPRYDPAGSSVVVERRQGGQWDLWLLDLETGTWQPLTDTPYSERHPDFLADGTGIVFASDRTGRYQLWSLDLAGTSLRQLTDEPGDNLFPAVGADGAIAYVNRMSGLSSLRITTGRPEGEVLLSSEATLDAPSWRPGGRVVVYNARAPERSDLEMLIDADIDVRRDLTRREDVFVGRVAWLGRDEFVYASDGQLWRRRIASSERRPVHMFAGVAIDQTEAPSFSFRLDDPGPHPVRGIRDFVRSADGRLAAFSALGDVWLIRGRSLQRLTADEYPDVEPRFIPGREEILFVSDRGGSFDLWRLALDGGAPTRVTAERGDVSAPVLSADGAIVHFVVTDEPAREMTANVRRIDLAAGGESTWVAGPFPPSVSLTEAGGRLVLMGAAIGTEQQQALIDAGPMAARNIGEPPATLGEFEDMSWRPLQAAEPYVVQAGRLFDGIGNDYRRHVDIHVAGQRITAIVARNRLPLPDRVIDYGEMTVIPGLVDVHAHHPENTGRETGLAWLRHGVTTVREVDARGAAAVERSESWASGARPGPRLFISPTSEGAEAAEMKRGPLIVNQAPGVSTGFAHAIEAIAPPRSEPTLTRQFRQPWADEEIALSPLNTTYQDTLAVLAGSGSYMSTGLSAALQSIAGTDRGVITMGQLGSLLQRTQRSFGRVAVGSDAPGVPYGYGFHMELEALVRAGVPNAQVLRWATAGGAMALGLDGQLGSLEAGQLADFVVINGDPLARITDSLEIEAVVKGGVFLREPDPARLRPHPPVP